MNPFGYGYGGYDGFSFLWMGLMMFFMVVGSIGVVLLIVWLARGGFGAGYRGRPESRDEALDIAGRRYAAGEITKEQYDEIVRTLRT